MEMKAGGDSGGGFVRADQIDLKRLDEQLEKHLSKAWTLEKTKNKEEAEAEATAAQVAVTSSNEQQQLQQQQPQRVSGNGSRQEWEIDASKLVIKSVIARGTFGTVHRGIYDGLDVAVKLLDWGEEGQRTDAEIASLRAAFTQEVAVWHKLDHPNVTKFIGAKVGSSGLQIQTENGQIAMPRNICCVIVEYLPGGALKNYLIKNRRRKLAFKVVMQLALDLARGLSYLHSQKIVHRDVKTENMLLDKSRTLKIADFGVARVEASNPSDMTGETGTLGYMAPEVLNGNPYNRKCDVYSFAICLWEIYCCDMPYPNLSFSEMTTAVVRQNLRPEIPRCCPSSFANVMKKCWDVNPDKRPEMDEAVALLEAIDTSKGGGRAFQQGFLNQEGSSSSSSSSTCGLSVEELKRIPWFDYKEEEKGEISGVDCAVCLESFKVGDKCRMLPSCHHCFHLQCVDLWLMKMPFCPICRANARPMKKSMVADELA